MSKRYLWRLKQREIVLGEHTLLMGVLNVTPDSFSDGGKYSDPDRAFARAIEIEEEGADILDIGAESTRPGSHRLPEAEELRRLIPVLKRLRGKLTIPISVDTYKSAVAEKALEHGAEIINDPTGIMLDLEAALNRVRQAGVQRHQIVIDPGLGFGKRREQNSEIIANLEALRSFDLPILVGPSRKSFLRKEQPEATEFATAAAVTACILNGAH